MYVALLATLLLSRYPKDLSNILHGGVDLAKLFQARSLDVLLAIVIRLGLSSTLAGSFRSNIASR
jgi:hypothetical protein